MKNENKIMVGAKVLNPDYQTWQNKNISKLGNAIGEVKDLTTYKELPEITFAWVQFRDYACGFNVANLEPIND